MGSPNWSLQDENATDVVKTALNRVAARLLLVEDRDGNTLGKVERDAAGRIVWSTTNPETAWPEDRAIDLALMNRAAREVLEDVGDGDGWTFRKYTRMRPQGDEQHQVIIEAINKAVEVEENSPSS